MFRLLVLIQGEIVAASRYRILQYLPYLEEHGVKSDIRQFPDTLSEYWRLLRDLPDYDAVFVQRKRFHFPVLQLFRLRANRVIFDLDDALMYKNSLARSPYSRTRERRFRNMIMRCDHILAGNSFLMEKCKDLNPAVTLMPSSIPADRYSLKDYTVEKEVVIIGWIGDHGSIHYLERMIPVWDEIARRYPGKVELKIICDTFFDCEMMPVRKVQWSSDTEIEELKDIDIGVMPLLDDPWSWGKCGLKILQYFGVGVPAVCTPVGVNRDVVTPGVNGYWALTDVEWIENLSRLIENGVDGRQQMGLAGRQALDEGYTRESNEPRILKVIVGQ